MSCNVSPSLLEQLKSAEIPVRAASPSVTLLFPGSITSAALS